jgi:hypothetical protein
MVGTYNENKMNAFYSNLNYLPKVNVSKNVKTIKFECILPIELQRICMAYSTSEGHNKSDPNSTYIKCTDYYDYEALKKVFKEKGFKDEIGEPRELSVNISHLVFPYPFNPRVFHHSGSMKYFPEAEKVMVLVKPFIPEGQKFLQSYMEDIHLQDGKPTKNVKAYPLFSYGFSKYQQIDEKKVLFTQVLIMDMGGWTNNEILLKILIKDRASKFKETMLRLAEELPENAQIEDFKEKLCRKEDGKVVDGFGSLLYQLKIGERNKEVKRRKKKIQWHGESSLISEDSFRKEFDHLNFSLHFESVFIEKEIGNAFSEFLKTEFNQEPWKFLCKLKELGNLKDFTAFKDNSKKIILDFINEGSPNEINISGKSKLTLMENYDAGMADLNDSNIEEIYQKLFFPIEKIVKQEMYHDSWKRFLRTNVCVSLMKKYKNNSSICSPQITELFSHSDDYFKHPFVYDQDFDFANLLIQDNNNWELLWTNEEKKMNTFYSKLNFFPLVKFSKNVKTVKFESVIPMSLQRVLLSYSTIEGNVKADPNTMYLKTLKNYSFEELKQVAKEKGFQEHVGKYQRGLSLNESHLAFPFPFDPRIWKYSCSMHYNPEDENVMVLLKPFIEGDIKFLEAYVGEVYHKSGKPMKKMKVYPLFSYGITKYQKIDEKKVLFTQMIVFDMGGWTNNEFILKMLVKERGSKLKETIMNLAKELPEDARIEDFKTTLCAEENGIPKDGCGKLLYDLKIE